MSHKSPRGRKEGNYDNTARRHKTGADLMKWGVMRWSYQKRWLREVLVENNVHLVRGVRSEPLTTISALCNKLVY